MRGLIYFLILFSAISVAQADDKAHPSGCQRLLVSKADWEKWLPDFNDVHHSRMSIALTRAGQTVSDQTSGFLDLNREALHLLRTMPNRLFALPLYTGSGLASIVERLALHPNRDAQVLNYAVELANQAVASLDPQKIAEHREEAFLLEQHIREIVMNVVREPRAWENTVSQSIFMIRNVTTKFGAPLGDFVMEALQLAADHKSCSEATLKEIAETLSYFSNENESKRALMQKLMTKLQPKQVVQAISQPVTIPSVPQEAANADVNQDPNKGEWKKDRFELLDLD